MSERKDEHVLHLLRELTERTLTEDEVDSAAEHIRECEDCALEVKFGRELFEAALTQGLTHIASERLVVHAESGEPLSGVESTHLAACRACQQDLATLRMLPDIEAMDLPIPVMSTEPLFRSGSESPAGDLPTTETPHASRSPREDRTKAPRSWWPLRVSWPIGWAFAAVALSALAFLIFGPERGVDTRDLANVHALELRIPRSVPDAGSFEASWMEAITLYQRANYAGAVVALEALVHENPSHFEATLLLGSALLLEDQVGEAIETLERSETIATTEADRSEARWQLANALLRRSHRDDARLAADLLSRIAEGPGSHAAEADALRREVVRRLPE
ncbi:MAG: hypothetical protein R3E12_16155 [Candidatus Eisenbacteria bacterium]|uniref:Tetratricopeptide repeat protein n=1 Tax=Eiseniibacteriota bacterium TaxID=2212470 RepID=A0A956RMS9_UNCEI|nr:hypothetical protein [Candidatus Eisenbacteria bacterium]